VPGPPVETTRNEGQRARNSNQTDTAVSLRGWCLYAEEQQQAIAAKARAEGRVDVVALALQLRVTTETIRRDLTVLEGPGAAAGARRGDPGRAAGLRPGRRVCVLPTRFDDSERPGLPPDVVTVDLRRYTPGQFADLLVAKLADLGISARSRHRVRRPWALRAGYEWARPLGGWACTRDQCAGRVG
jgi:hypothetical protein